MPPVLIACPVTGDLVPTGETVASLEELEGEYLLIACSDCGRDHEWTRAEAVIAAAAALCMSAVVIGHDATQVPWRLVRLPALWAVPGALIAGRRPRKAAAHEPDPGSRLGAQRRKRVGSLNGRVVLLTGAAGGIGAAAARLFVAKGARLILVDIQRAALDALASDLGETALSAPADITESSQLEEVVRAAKERFGGIDVVVANAAIDAYAPVAEIDPATFDRVVEVNLLGTFRTARAALPAMAGRRGHILIINSLGSIVPAPFLSAYAASKAGLAAFADSLRLELRGSGTSVGVLYFGAVDTEHFRTGMAHPLMQRANARIPKSLTAAASAEDAAVAIERAVERRSRRAVFPRSNAPLLWAPRTFQRMAERWISN